ncbi:MAG: aldo/keto reductase [Phycisphaerales bacterium]|nr:MAG: aldo/keto reductase [Phycisphaerales bacterium]
MLTRQLGTSGINVSALGLGTRALGGDVADWGAVDDNESIAAINRALDSGINLVDTAPSYGNGHSETIVGRAVRARRHQVVIATKCGMVAEEGNGTRRRCLTKDSIRAECEASLRRLHTDYIDLYQCHCSDPSTPIRETMEAMVSLRQEGRIRAIGLCDFGCEQIAAALEFGPIHSVQLAFSLLTRRAATDLVPYCQEHNIAVLAHSPLALGLLAGEFHGGSRISGLRAKDPEFTGSRFARNLDFVGKLQEIARASDRTVAQIALNWAANHPGVTSAVFGATRLSQVDENTGAVGWTLEPRDTQSIQALLGNL